MPPCRERTKKDFQKKNLNEELAKRSGHSVQVIHNLISEEEIFTQRYSGESRRLNCEGTATSEGNTWNGNLCISLDITTNHRREILHDIYSLTKKLSNFLQGSSSNSSKGIHFAPCSDALNCMDF